MEVSCWLQDIGGEVESDDEEMESYERMLKKMVRVGGCCCCEGADWL